MRCFTRIVATTMLTALLQGPIAPFVYAPAAMAQTAPEAVASEAAIGKMNAYVGFLNQALRASESLQRYDSWVDMKKGPTGKEKIIYGLYSLYDVRTEIAAVKAASTAEPLFPELDSAMLAYVETYEKLAPAIEKANKYYEREDYKSDDMAGGKALHTEIAALAPVFLERRAAADAALRQTKVKIDLAALAALEQAEGKKSRWHVRNVMFRAEAVMDLMPSNEKPVVDMVAFKQTLGDYSAAVKAFDDYSLEHPNSFHVFESSPAGLLSRLREFDEKLSKAKGDARKGAGEDMTWIVSDYNTMVSLADTATVFSKD